MLKITDIVGINYKMYYSADKNIDKIASNTKNTWQENRTYETKKKDTELGKIAEWCVETYIRENFKDLMLLAYDELRTDNFSKHAPFDCLIYQKTQQSKINNIVAKINKEITNSPSGSISDYLKKECLDNHIYICEIKSTRIVAPRLKNDNGEVKFDSILNDDFLTYPKYLRVDTNGNINSLKAYVDFINIKYGSSKTINKIEQEELCHMSHLYIRVYIDEDTKIGYIISLIDNESFLRQAEIKHMPQKNKSEKALYLATKIINGVSINCISELVR